MLRLSGFEVKERKEKSAAITGKIKVAIPSFIYLFVSDIPILFSYFSFSNGIEN